MRYLKIFSVLIIFTVLMTNCSQIPSDVEYKILNEKFVRTYKKSLIDVELNKRVSKDVLTLIAEEIKSKYPDSRNFMINYYLKGSDRNIAWAITHFNPEPDIQILGSTDEENKSMNNATLPTGEIIGIWNDNTATFERRIILFKQNDTLKLHSIFKDGSNGDEILKLKKQNGEIKYINTENPIDYYVIESTGNLIMYRNNKKYSESMKE
ncbi:MAG: hypothetical protein PHR83_18130 [Paludibacter sp.]|nr:hypothetical protein [Paludibacter sp.]